MSRVDSIVANHDDKALFYQTIIEKAAAMLLLLKVSDPNLELTVL